jgi:outer membrane DcaP-like protein
MRVNDARKIIVHLFSAGFFTMVATSGAGAQDAAQSVPISRLDIYGFVMTDLGYDFKTNNPDWFDVNRPSELPSFQDEFGRNGKTYAGVRQTQFGVKGYQSTPMGELKTQFEFDFFGVGPDAGQTTIFPRYFYSEIGAFGAGQTDSPFTDINVFPNTLDYWGPNGTVDFRNVQVRWMPIRGETRLTLALERPGSTQDPGLLANRIEVQNIRGRFPLPDFTGDYRQAWNRGYVKGSWVLRKIKLDDLLPNDGFNLDDSVIGWGVWTDKWITSVGYSQLAVDNTILQRPEEFHRGQYAIANLLYSPQEHMLFGGEAQWARRTNFRWLSCE